MRAQAVTKTEMARRMCTNRAAVDRLLDLNSEAVTLSTLQKAASAIGREIRLELVKFVLACCRLSFPPSETPASHDPIQPSWMRTAAVINACQNETLGIAI